MPKYRNESLIDGRESLFIVSISDREIVDLNFGSKLRRFENLVLERLANMIAAYIFKHYKENKLFDPILDEVKEKISLEVSRDILSRLGLPLENSHEG